MNLAAVWGWFPMVSLMKTQGFQGSGEQASVVIKFTQICFNGISPRNGTIIPIWKFIKAMFQTTNQITR
jgi:hypothetical protein